MDSEYTKLMKKACHLRMYQVNKHVLTLSKQVVLESLRGPYPYRSKIHLVWYYRPC